MNTYLIKNKLYQPINIVVAEATVVVPAKGEVKIKSATLPPQVENLAAKGQISYKKVG